MPLNNENCCARLKSLVRKFKQDMKIFHKYERIISEQVDKGTISRVADIEEADKVSYLPHSAVLHQNAETKVGVVYEASCRDKQDLFK